jgi:hypothetical protein
MSATKVFVSSVSKGLEDTRGELIQDLGKAGYDVNGMEQFGAQSDPPIEVCLRELRKTDVVVLIVGPRYGSLLPQDISYTHAEFREARALGIPVLAFRIPDGPDLLDDEKTRLRAFHTEVGSAATYDSLAPGESTHRLASKVQAALTRANNRGVLGRRYSLFQAFDRFFAAQLADSAVFNHKGTFFGRQAELQRLSEFFAGAEQLVIVTAPGGSGKSRLLLEAAKAATGPGSPEVLFVDSGAQWSAGDINGLPATAGVLIFDDAHRRPDLDRLIAACQTRNDQLRYVISCRPSAIGFVRPLLRAVGTADTTPPIALAPLSQDDAAALACDHLGADFAYLSDRLVKMADRNPLVISVGARCISRRVIAPEVLGGSPEEFRVAVLDRLLDDPGLQGEDARSRRVVLEVISAIGPVSTESAEVVSGIAKYANLPEHELRRLLALLETTGFLMRRGRLVRVNPDVLADHLLYRAAVDANGAPTRFVEAIIEHFRPTSLENILANAAELDWRGATSTDQEPVLRATWRDLARALPHATHRERAQLLGQLKKAALFAPEQVCDIADWLADHPDAPRDEQLSEWGLEDSPNQVDDALKDTFGFIAGHSSFTKRCLARLWTYAAVDTRATNLIPEHPRRRIEQLLKYEREWFWRPDDGVQVKAIDFLIERLLAPHSVQDAAWVIPLLGAALDRVGENNKYTPRHLTMRSFSLAPFAKHLSSRRRAILDCLKAVALGDRVAEAGAAVRELAELLVVPWGPLGQDLKDEDRAAWRSETELAISHLLDIAASAATDVIRFIARKELRQASGFEWLDVFRSIVNLANATPPSPNEPLYDLLIGAPTPKPHYDFRAEGERLDGLCAAAAAELWKTHATPKDLLSALLAAIDALTAVAVPGQAARLVHAIVRASPHSAEAIISGLVSAGRIGWPLIQSALLAAPDQPADLADTLLLELSSAADDELRIVALDTLEWMVLRDRDLRPFVDLVRILAKDPSPTVRRSVPQVLRRLREKAPAEALQILVSIDWESDVPLGKTVLAALHPQYGLDPNSLTDAYIDTLLGRLGTMPDIDEYHVLEFVSFASTKRPRETLQMLLDRITNSGNAKRRAGDDRWTPLPYNGRGLSLPGVSVDLTRLVRDAILGAHPRGRFWIPELFAVASPDLATAIALLKEWSRSGDGAKVVAAACLLSGFGHGLIFSAHEFIADLLDAAAAVGSKCLRDVESELYSLAVGGVYSGKPGEPMPRHLNDKSEGERLSKLYDSRPPARAFYRSVVEHAEGSIKREQQSWDEEDVE